VPLPAPLTRLAVAGALALTGVLVATPTATAAPEAPTNVTLSLDSVNGGSARVSWDRVPGATGYVVQIDDSADFGSTLVSQATVNRVYVTPTQMPTATTLYVRVQAKQDSSSSPWSAAQSGQRPALAAPAGAQPVDGAVLAPGASPSFTWDPVAGASSYQVRIATSNSSECETAQVKSGGWTSESTQFVVRDRVLKPSQPYYWCVRAALPNNVNSEWTAPTLLQIGNLGAPTLVAPAIGATVRDVTLDWDPVPGASTYQLQVGWDQEFSNGVRIDTTLKATTWGPNPKILDNRTWYWRVRALDASGNPHAWSTFRFFTRAWTDQPVLEWPANNADVPTADMYYEWSAVPRADYYTLQTASDADFTAGVTNCTTSHTTFVGECGGNPNGYTYWRVLANEDQTLGINIGGAQYEHTTRTEVTAATPYRRYRSVIARPLQTAPANGASLAASEVPTLEWQPVTFAATYDVTVTNLGNGDTITNNTTATAFTPRARLAAGVYAWEVTPRTIDGVGFANRPLGQQPTFTVQAYAPDAPVAGAPGLLPAMVSGYRPPTLAWQPVQNATRYVVQVKPVDDTGWQRFADTFGYPEAQDDGAQFLAPGTYDWQVLPYNEDQPLAASAIGRFTIKAPYDPLITSYGTWLSGMDIEAALGGNAMYGNAGEAEDHCQLTTSTSAGCSNLRETPMLQWSPKAGATENPNIAYYRLAIYADQARTTSIVGPQKVRGHAWMRTAPIADAQGGQEGATSAYWVELIPCTYSGCATSASSDPTVSAPLAHAFNKSYNQAVTLAPANDAVVPVSATPGDNDLVFAWKDMLAAEASASVANTALKNSHADTEAVKYQLSYARLADFSDATTVTVDHTTYTLPTPLSDGDVYWRVRARDDDDNPFNWSDVAHFTITSPPTTGLSPSSADTAIGGRQALSWAPTPYAPKYVVEVYAGDVPQGSSTTNRKINDQDVFGTTWTPGTLLAPGLYTWRVRGKNASDNLMSWSAWRQFTVAPDSPTQLQAPPDADIAPQDLFMSWTEVAGATQYKVAWRPKVGGTTTSITTTGRAWAPTAAIGAAGEWEWQVTAMRGSTTWGAPSPWRTFRVALSPTATTPVSIPPSAVVGGNLTLTPPVWDFTEGASTTYQWFRGSTAIAGATGTVYSVTGDDFGKALKVVATIQVPGYLDGVSTSGTVTPTASGAPTATVVPVIGGDAHADGTLTVTTEAAWSNGATTTYQWLRDGTALSGKTGPTYVVQGADAGHSLAVRAIGKLTGHTDGVVTSNSIAALTGPAATSTSVPEITGGTPVGSTLSLVAPPTWERSGSPVTANCTKYEWLRGGAPISGATSATYKTVDADASLPVSVRVSCVQTGYDTGGPAISSNAVVPVLGPAPSVVAPPAITGNPVTGQRLEATTGSWSSATSETKYAYQWLRGGAPISGATSYRYTLATADAGQSIAVRVTAKTPGYAPGEATSAPVVVSLAANSKVSSTTTITRSAAKVRKGKKVTLSVVVTAAGRTSLGTVTIEFQIPGKSGVKTKTITLNGANTGVTKIKLKVKGKYKFRAVYKGMTNTTGSSSAWVTVKAR